MKLNNSSHKPLYLQLKEVIKEDIKRGKYKPGQKLPTESELCNIYEISRITVRRAISDLVEEKILQRQQGKGTFVQNIKIKRELVSIGGFSEITMASGKTPNYKMLSKKVIASNSRLSSIFRIKNQDEVIELNRLLLIDDDPFIIEKSYFPSALFPGFEKHIKNDTSTYKLIKELYSIEIVRAEKTLDFTYASQFEAKLFQCEVNSPMYIVEKTSYDQNGRSVHFSQSYFLTSKVMFTLAVEESVNKNASDNSKKG